MWLARTRLAQGDTEAAKLVLAQLGEGDARGMAEYLFCVLLFYLCLCLFVVAGEGSQRGIDGGTVLSCCCCLLFLWN